MEESNILFICALHFEYMSKEDKYKYEERTNGEFNKDVVIISIKGNTIELTDKWNKKINVKKRTSIQNNNGFAFFINDINKRRCYTEVIDIKNLGEEDLENDDCYDGYINSVLKKYREDNERSRVVYLGQTLYNASVYENGGGIVEL